MCTQLDLLGFYLVKEWNRAATHLMLALTRTEWTLLELVCELLHYAWRGGDGILPENLELSAI